MNFYIEYPIILAFIIPVLIVLAILMNKCFIKFTNKQEKREYEKAHKGRKIFVIITRCFIILYLLVALSSPYTLKEEVMKGDYSLKILVDNSTSMELFDTNVANDVFNNIKEKIPVTIIPIGSKDYSPIGDELINKMHGNDNILLITDGQNNKGKELSHVMFFANLLNTTINSLEIPSKNYDYSVVIEGPSEAIVGTENEFFVRIYQAGSPPEYSLYVTVDDQPTPIEKVDNNLYKFSKALSHGYHKIKARLETQDYFKENNIYYKSIHVLPKPTVLYVTAKDPRLTTLLRPIYDIEVKENIPQDLTDYSAIILDDMHSSKLDSKTEYLSDYVLEGGGLFVMGGEYSFDKGDYQNSLFETLLPVKVGEAGAGGELSTTIVLVIDISESTGQDFSRTSSTSKVDVEKSLALEIIKGIDLRDRVGVVAFNHKAYSLARVGLLGEIESNITQKISALHDTGGTLVYSGLKQAERLMDGSLGSKNVILISDGVDAIPSLSLDLAKEFADKNIKLFTVGVGEATNRAFLQTLAVETGAQYFEPSQTQKLKILFGKREEMPQQETQSLVLFNTDHFITSGLSLNADVTGFNYVVKKASAQMLVSMGDGKPILTAWRYGLGRVIALSTDSGEKWSTQLLSTTNSKILMRSINWAIGDPQKNLKFYVKVKDTYLGETSKVLIKSNQQLTSNTLDFEKTDEDRYISYFTPSKVGHQEIFKAIIAVNNPIEYERVGLNNNLKDLVEITGGKTFKPSQTDELVDFIKTRSVRTKTTPRYWRWPFILIALIILLVEIFVRKIIESIRREK
jgi:uncharacterized membrane protein